MKEAEVFSLYDPTGHLHLERLDPALREIAEAFHEKGFLPTTKTVYASPQEEQRALLIDYLHGIGEQMDRVDEMRRRSREASLGNPIRYR